jgi:hypothetical protein
MQVGIERVQTHGKSYFSEARSVGIGDIERGRKVSDEDSEYSRVFRIGRGF